MKDIRRLGKMAVPFLCILLTVVMGCASASPVVRNGQNAQSGSAESTVLTLETLQHDPELNRVILLRFDEARLDEVLKALDDQRKLKLTLVPELAPRRITARC